MNTHVRTQMCWVQTGPSCGSPRSYRSIPGIKALFGSLGTRRKPRGFHLTQPSRPGRITCSVTAASASGSLLPTAGHTTSSQTGDERLHFYQSHKIVSPPNTFLSTVELTDDLGRGRVWITL